MKIHFQYFHFHRKWIQWQFCKYCENAKGPTWLMWVCVSEKSDFKKKKLENNVKPCMVNFIFKLYIQKKIYLLYSNYVFKIIYQTSLHIKIGLFFFFFLIFNFRIWIQKRKNEKWIHHFLEPNRALPYYFHNYFI